MAKQSNEAANQLNTYTIKQSVIYLGQIVFISWFTGYFLNLGSGDEKKISENAQLTGHFQSFFLISELFLIPPEQTVKLEK